MKTTAERIQSALDIRGMKQADLAAQTKIGKSSIHAYVTGDYLPKQNNIYKMALALNVSEAWLMGYDVPMERNAPTRRATVPPGFEPLPEMEQVPLVGSIACGEPITAEENVEGTVGVPAMWRADFALACKGNSMEPTIKDGDVVAIRSQPAVENGQIAAVRIVGEATLKKVYIYPDRVELRPINPECEMIVLYGEDINTAAIEGLAVGLCRGI